MTIIYDNSNGNNSNNIVVRDNITLATHAPLPSYQHQSQSPQPQSQHEPQHLQEQDHNEEPKHLQEKDHEEQDEPQQQKDEDILDPSQLSFKSPAPDDRYTVNGFDVSGAFYEFQESIKNHKHKLPLESHLHHALAASSILFLKHGRYPDDMVKIFGEDQLEAIVDDLNDMFGVKKAKLPIGTVTDMINIIQNVIDENMTRYQAVGKLLLMDGKVPANQFKFIKSVAKLLEKLPRTGIVEEVKENELCTRYADPLLCGLFDDPDAGIFLRWTDQTTLEGKKSLNISKRRPDICITTLKGINWDYNSGFGEAKASSEGNNHYYLCKDLLRVAIFGKNSIDTSNMDGVIGMQVVGRSITFYLMVLLSDGLYIMLELERISIPGSLDDLLKYLMDMNKILMVLDVFEEWCRPVSAAQASRFDKRKRKTLSTPGFCQIMSSETSRKRSCILKHYYN
ncbi:uncharacterized protein BX664DRAFT_264424 [Halteromyces radiatus]|uniref:uncharacterized protein n=1 Tax=Halteromyces radiatus TaxID=101107 RepID=UPI00221F2D0B|nr:uncharacterized protein BX664DRAFT_264424 [Halteromyces radiatus]KAI8086653.1 hypothetical protein BX664DRAFT_264424 [Halteromyces radiatus]